ncbi:MAG: response regulator [Planctomycetes bacterium]|nr:response regulator [Phycisphaerae bacterium]NBB95538.1 response regulator [Planctomycetota bacterium]
MTALVVDDSAIMRKMVMRSLTEAGVAEFTYVEAVDGQDALDKFDPETIEILFVDWNMPNMNGLEFVKKVRETIDYHVPTVMVTTESTMGKVEEAMDEAGVDTFICKPFTTDVLKKKLGPLFEKLEDDGKSGEMFFGSLAKKFA